jgi:hypothetical protein
MRKFAIQAWEQYRVLVEKKEKALGKTRALWGSNLSAKMENSTGYKIRLVRTMS